MSIIVPHIYVPNQKPPVGTPLDPYHPLSPFVAGSWAFNEGAGPNHFDVSVNRNHATFNNFDPGDWAYGVHGYALDMNGTNDEITVPNHSSLFGMSQLTLLVWVQWLGSARANEDSLIDAWNTGDTNYLFRFDSNNSNVDFHTDTSIGSAGGAFAGIDLSDKLWHQVVATYDGTTMRVYLDGIPSATTVAQTGSIDAGSTDVRICGQLAANNDEFHGKISLAQIYRKALAQSQIHELRLDPFQMYLRPQAIWASAAAAAAAGIPILRRRRECA